MQRSVEVRRNREGVWGGGVGWGRGWCGHILINRKPRDWFFERGVWEKTSGLELVARTLLARVYSLTNGVLGPEL